MTTVVATRDAIASDMLVVDCGTRTKLPKLFEVKGDVIGIAGDYNQGKRFVAWYGDRRKKKPDLNEEFEALVLTKQGHIVVWTSEFVPCEMGEDFWAIGSGRDAALAAIHMSLKLTGKANLYDAVECATKVDASSDLPIHMIERKQ